MNYLLLTSPSEEYGKAISHELWMLARPRTVSGDETSQFFCGVSSHPDGRVMIGPLDGTQPVHANADELSFSQLISIALDPDATITFPAYDENGEPTEGVTLPEEEALVAAITEAKGGSIDIVGLIEASPSLSANLRTREQLDADGWFPSDGI